MEREKQKRPRRPGRSGRQTLASIWSIIPALEMGLLSNSSLKDITVANYSDLNLLRSSEKRTKKSFDLETIDSQKLASTADIYGGSWPFIDPAQITRIARTKSIQKRNRRKISTARSRRQRKSTDSARCEIDDETTGRSFNGDVSPSFEQEQENHVSNRSSSWLSTDNSSSVRPHARPRDYDEDEDDECLSESYGSADEDEETHQITSNTNSKEIAHVDNTNFISTDCGYSSSYSSSQTKELHRTEPSEYPKYSANSLKIKKLHADDNNENDEYDDVTSNCDTSLNETRHARFKKYATRSSDRINSRKVSVKRRNASSTAGKKSSTKKHYLRSSTNHFKTLKRKQNRLIKKKQHRNPVANFRELPDNFDGKLRNDRDGMFNIKKRDANIVQIHCDNTRHNSENIGNVYKKNFKYVSTAIKCDIEAEICSAEITKGTENIPAAASEITDIRPNEQTDNEDSKNISMEYDWMSGNENILSQDTKQSFDLINAESSATVKPARRNKRYKSPIDCNYVDKKEAAYQGIFHDCVDLDSPIAASSLKISIDESWISEDRDSDAAEMIHSSWRRSTLTEDYNNEFDSALLLARKIISDDSIKIEKYYDDEHETPGSTCYKHEKTPDILPATKRNSVQTNRDDTLSDDNAEDTNLSSIEKITEYKKMITYRRIRRVKKNQKRFSRKPLMESMNQNPVKNINEDIKIPARITRSTKVDDKDLTRRLLNEKIDDFEYDSDGKYVPRRVTRALVKTSQENHAGKLIWGLCSGWWPALIVDAEHVGMAPESGKLWVYWMGESQISLLAEKTQIQPFSAKLEHRLTLMTSRKNIRSRAINATIQMLHQRFASTLTKPYYNWIQRNIARVRRLDDLIFYPYPDNVQEKLNELRQKNIKTTKRYILNRNNPDSPEATPTKKQSTERTRQSMEKNIRKETNTSWKQIDDERLPLQNQFPGAIAWAKIAGHSWWPAMIVDYRDCCLKEPSFGCQWIMWYGDYQVSEVRHLEFLKFHKGLEKMRNHIQNTVKQSYVEGVLQASKDYCSRLGCNTDNWTLDNVFEYFSNMNNIHVAHNQLRVSESNKIYDKYSNTIVKKINESMSKPSVDAERKSDIRASNALPKVISGERAVEKLCLKCLKFPRGAMEAHPFFIGSLCRECSSVLKPCMFVHGNDGKCFYCTVCAATGTVIVCDIEDCPRVYCTACLKFLLCPKSYDNMLSEDPWECFLCRDESRQPVDAIVHPRFDWKEKLTKMFRTVSNFVSDDLELVSYKKEKKPIRVLSLFDGLSTGFVVLSKLGIAVEAYYASEIDVNSLTISSSHFGDRVIQLGDVRNITEKMIEEIAPIDLLIGGSPCNDLSLVNPARLGLHDYNGTGVLFFDYCRIKKLLGKVNKGRHLFWLFENVASMPTEYRLEINKHLGQEPDVIDAADFSPQHRLRLYWHNFPFNPYMPLYQNHQDVQDKLIPNLNRKALCKKLRTVTSRKGSLLQGKAELKPIMMKGESDTLWITELEEIFGFPRHYTDVKNLSATNRQKLLGKSWSVQTLTAILRPLCFYFKCNEDEISKSTVEEDTSIVKRLMKF